MQEKIRSGEIVFSADESKIIRKIYLADQQGRVPENIWNPEDAGTTRDANREIKDVFEDVVFDTPKPTALVRRILQLATAPQEGAIVLDFFAGSGTTGHSVLALNEEDGGNRRFVLIQLPEPTERRDFPTIADICEERIRRVIQRLEAEESGTLAIRNQQASDRGFRVFKLDESNFTPWDADVSHDPEALKKQLELHVDHVRKGRTPDDLLIEILLKSGFTLTTPVEKLTLAGKTVHSVADGALFVCLDDALTLDLIRAMADRKPERVVCLDQGFAGADQLKANAVQIFKTKGVTSFKTV